MAAPSGRFTSVSAVDQVRRIYTSTHVGSRALMLGVAISEEDVFAARRGRAAVIATAAQAPYQAKQHGRNRMVAWADMPGSFDTVRDARQLSRAAAVGPATGSATGSRRYP